MSMRVRTVLSGLCLAMLLGGGALAGPAPVEGLYSPDGVSDYRVSLCGPDKDALCVMVAALREGADNKRNRPYLGKNIIDEAAPKGENRWQGKLNLFGQSADGTMVFVAPDRIELKGCMLMVICQSITLKRIGD